MKLGRSSLLGSSALLLAGTLVALAVAEAYFRWVSPVPPNEDRWFHPYQITGSPRNAGSWSEESPESLGYRRAGAVYFYRPDEVVSTIQGRGDYFFGERPPVSQPDSRGRRKSIVILGASMALGSGVKDPARKWTALLQNELRAKLHNDRIDVMTVATNSFVSTQERLALELYVLPRKPDAVVLLDGFNDMGALLHLSRPGDPFNMGTLYARHYSFRFQLALWASDRSALVRHFLVRSVQEAALRLRREVEEDPTLSGNYTQGIASVYDDNLKRMSRRCHQESIPCFFFFQPNRALTQHYNGGVADMRLYPRISLRMLELLRKGPFSPGTEFRDLTHLLDKRPELYVDRVHMSEEGQEMLANSVAEVLLASPKLR